MKINIQSENILMDKTFDCDFSLPKGSLTVIHGANGVGKSSLIHHIKHHQKLIFSEKNCVYVDQKNFIPLNNISLSDLEIQLADQQIERLEFLDDVAELVSTFRDKPIKELSGGQNQLAKIYLACFLSGDIFIMDEPLQQLDKQNLKKIKVIMAKLKQLNKTLLIVEHRVDEIVNMIDHSYLLFEQNHLVRMSYGN